MTLFWIILGTLGAGIGSVWLAALLSFGALARYTQHMLSLAAGALMATALLNLLPEAFESGREPHDLFLTLLIGVVFFFLLDKAELWHHGHEHHHGSDDGGHGHGHGHGHGNQHAHEHLQGHVHDHEHGHAHDHVSADATAHGHGHSHATANAVLSDAGTRLSGSWAVLAGDSVHCFGDGVLIASAFMADLRLGAIASLAVLAHEIPHHMGDLVVLRAGVANRRTALIKVSMAGAVTSLGGIAGFWLLERLHDYLPFFLVAASSSFMYVALADLIPQLQKHLSAKQTAAQIAWLAVGIAMVSTVAGLAGHSH